MKALLVLLLLIPIVHANNALELRKTNLEARADEFIAQMDAVIEFSENKSINTTVFEASKSDFEDKLEEALESETKDDLLSIEKEMRVIADDFKKEVKVLLKDYLEELKDEIKKLKKSTVTKVLDGIKKEAEKVENASKDQDVEEARETLRNAFSGFGSFFDKIKSFFTENTKNISDHK